MNRNKMLMGVKEPETTVFVNRGKVLDESRTITPSSLGIGYHKVPIADVVKAFLDLEKEEIAAGHFNIHISLPPNYEDDPDEIEIYYQRYETSEDISKREKAKLKKEAKKKALEENLKDPKYQQGLIDRMNKNVASTFKF